jgi:hypothetical protein
MSVININWRLAIHKCGCQNVLIDLSFIVGIFILLHKVVLGCGEVQKQIHIW